MQNYYESGQYDKEFEKIIDEALSELEKIELSDNSIAVFDVDDTILSGYEYTKNIGFGYTWESWNDYVARGIGEAIPQTKILYDWLINRNVKVILLTGRRDYMYDATKENLVLRGYKDFDTLICKPAEVSITTGEFKYWVRKHLFENGNKIIVTVGDQESDFVGGLVGLKIKVPNYLYLIN